MNWSTSADATSGEPPGRGKFLIKTGSGPGTPVQLQMTEIERDVNDTNRRWATAARKAHRLAADLTAADALDLGGAGGLKDAVPAVVEQRQIRKEPA